MTYLKTAFYLVAVIGLTPPALDASQLLGDLTSPRSTVETLYQSIKQNRIEVFQQTLGGPARDTYGNQDSFEYLRKQVPSYFPTINYKEVFRDEPRRVGEKGVSETEVLAANIDLIPPRQMNLSVSCELTRLPDRLASDCRVTDMTDFY